MLLSDVNKKAASKEKGYVFVCNDVIIITLPAKGGYKTVDRVDMDQAILEDVADPDRTSFLFSLFLLARFFSLQLSLSLSLSLYLSLSLRSLFFVDSYCLEVIAANH